MFIKKLKTVLKVNPPKPIEYQVCYWKSGVHMWKAGYNMEQLYRKVLKPFDDLNKFIYVITYSKHQCWG